MICVNIFINIVYHRNRTKNCIRIKFLNIRAFEILLLFTGFVAIILPVPVPRNTSFYSDNFGSDNLFSRCRTKLSVCNSQGYVCLYLCALCEHMHSTKYPESIISLGLSFIFTVSLDPERVLVQFFAIFNQEIY